MTEDAFPSLRIGADERRITVDLPPSDQTQLPTVPEGLRGEEIPSFVVEWIVEADEMGLIVQELLQAPTKSLCRIFRTPTYDETQFGTPKVDRDFLGGTQLSGPTFEVGGFSATTAPPDTVAGLPTGIDLPERLLEIIEMAKRLEAWIEKGRRVAAWAEERGQGQASWLPANQG